MVCWHIPKGRNLFCKLPNQISLRRPTNPITMDFLYIFWPNNVMEWWSPITIFQQVNPCFVITCFSLRKKRITNPIPVFFSYFFCIKNHPFRNWPKTTQDWPQRFDFLSGVATTQSQSKSAAPGLGEAWQLNKKSNGWMFGGLKSFFCLQKTKILEDLVVFF